MGNDGFVVIAAIRRHVSRRRLRSRSAFAMTETEDSDMAAAAITVAHQRRINVPGEISICGFDDTPLASAIWPALTTIRQPIRDMSREAIGLLAMRFRNLDEGAAGVIGKVKLDYQLIRRQSDAVPARH